MVTQELIVCFEEDVLGMPSVSERKMFAEALRHNPGRIALLGATVNRRVAQQYAYRIRNAIPSMHMFTPAGHFEAEAKTMFGTTRIYVRYIGDKP